MGFLGAVRLALLYAGSASSLPVTIIETAIGAVLFVLTPNKVQGYIKSFFARSLKLETVSADVRVKEYLSMQLEKSAKAFKSLEECFSKCFRRKD